MLTEILLVSSVLSHRVIFMTSAYHFASACWYLIRSLTLESKRYSINGEIIKDWNDLFFPAAVILQNAVEINDLSFLSFFISIICGYSLPVWVLVIITTLFCMYAKWTTFSFLLSIYALKHVSGTRPVLAMCLASCFHFIIAAINPLNLEWFELAVGIVHSEAMIQAYDNFDVQRFACLGAIGCSIGPIDKSIWCYFPSLMTFTYFWNVKWKMFNYMPIGISGIWFICLSMLVVYIRNKIID